MLPNLYYQSYKQFAQMLSDLHEAIAKAPEDVQALRQSFLAAQQFFTQQIVSLDSNELEPTDEPRVRSYQTEISKQLQLLGIDVMFLQAARQQQTAQNRQRQISQRLQTLISYCNSVLLLQ